MTIIIFVLIVTIEFVNISTSKQIHKGTKSSEEGKPIEVKFANVEQIRAN